MRRLIVNADDLGYSAGVTRGILEAHARGIVTSASLMVDEPAAAGAVELAPASLAVGLHAVLDRDGLIASERCEAELERQLARFVELTGRQPTHLDSHHHVHRERSLQPAVAAFADRHGLPLRDHDVAHCGAFYGGASIEVASLLETLGALPEGDSELGCHPGYADGLSSRYTGERELELRTLTDPRVRAGLDELGIEPIRWDEL